MNARTILLLGAALQCLVACGGILPKPPPPPLLYRLTPLATAAPAQPAIAAQLVVALPVAPSGLDTERIALSRSPTTIDYFADAAWTDRVPLMMQTVLVESLENAGQVRVVARQSPEMRGDVLLAVDVRHFEADYNGDSAPEVRVVLDCRLIRMPDRNAIAVKSFAGTVRAAENETPAIVDAFDAAFHAAMREAEPWVAASLAPAAR
jgi:cholesterol transport system auxiliary component